MKEGKGELEVCEKLRRAFPYMKDVKQRVISAVCALYRYDRELLDIDANERSITHKLAEHLQREFPEWHVDCEYNQCGADVKRLRGISVGKPELGDLEAKTVFPDIIVHRRMTEENLLVIEVKKANNHASIEDIDKLKLFTKAAEYRYKYGLFLGFDPNGNSELKLYENGESKADWSNDLRRILKELGYGE